MSEKVKTKIRLIGTTNNVFVWPIILPFHEAVPGVWGNVGFEA